VRGLLGATVIEIAVTVLIGAMAMVAGWFGVTHRATGRALVRVDRVAVACERAAPEARDIALAIRIRVAQSPGHKGRPAENRGEVALAPGGLLALDGRISKTPPYPSPPG
jgi:hypothetical protein